MKLNAITLIKRIVLVTITGCSGAFIWATFSPRKMEEPVYAKYIFLQQVQTNQVSEDEIFSEEIDTIFYDRLGIKNIRFKKSINLKQQEL